MVREEDIIGLCESCAHGENMSCAHNRYTRKWMVPQDVGSVWYLEIIHVVPGRFELVDGALKCTYCKEHTGKLEEE